MSAAGVGHLNQDFRGIREGTGLQYSLYLRVTDQIGQAVTAQQNDIALFQTQTLVGKRSFIVLTCKIP